MPNVFHDIRFPDGIAHDSESGPNFKTDITEASGGNEVRNRRWQYPLHKYDVSYGVKTANDVYLVKTFHMLRGGSFASFRFKDWDDYRSLGPQTQPSTIDQEIGTTDGVTAEFQLVKTYSDAVATLVREIFLPVSGTVLLAKDAVPLTEGVDFSVDYQTGIVTLLGGHPGGVGEVITAGFEFDVKVRFLSDYLPVAAQGGDLASVPQIMLKELRKND